MDDPVVSTAWLAERLGSVRVVDGSWHMPAEARNGAAEYLQRHIPGAVFFDIDHVADHDTDLPHMLPRPEAFAQAAGALGLSRETDIVVYDVHGIRSAARVWWTLRVMGYDKVHVLDGGLRKWLAEGRPVEAGDVVPQPVTVAPRFEAELVRNAQDVQAILQSGAARMLDARSAARFRGEAPEPRAGLRSGHMPGAANLPWEQVIAEDGTLRPSEELKSVFDRVGVDLAKPIVTTCGSGVTASVLALALARLGICAAVYDGSWSEWGGLADAPIVTGP
ncbi:thiosulfate/3-mercaptopyruvate sulfurtransferase [Phenylobacterium haematophilum]|uniref:Sulfurtransferase n=1 Tax=Phenylobacterium haematophilum TaxID=98513 RepID=A0A839ZVI2_9CAUL|nr:3-mercaptopyruvate sulfurtransferase [Phenylobacterium haematophilum]MBB3890064.1 thiosulfate/3-mercaptopyruvate sulfurtransferase [Phenylobacterium haematophilum]